MRIHRTAFALTSAFLIMVCLFAQVYAGAEPMGSIIEVMVPTQFPLSDSVQVVNTGAEVTALAGNVQIIKSGQSNYLFIPAQVENGAKLISLNDQEHGVIFRNNTVVLPVYKDSSRIASLVLAMDGMTANPDGFFGRVTGAELDIQGAAGVADGYNFSVDIAIFLKEISQKTTYQVRTDRANDVTDVIEAGLSPSGLSTLDIPVVVGVDSPDTESDDSIDFMIVSLKADSRWVQQYSGSNITLFKITHETASPLSTRGLKSGNDSLVYQAMLPGSSRLALAAIGNKTDKGIVLTTSNALDVVLFGGLLIILMFMLGIIIKRVIKR